MDDSFKPNGITSPTPTEPEVSPLATGLQAQDWKSLEKCQLNQPGDFGVHYDLHAKLGCVRVRVASPGVEVGKHIVAGGLLQEVEQGICHDTSPIRISARRRQEASLTWSLMRIS